MTFQKTSNLDAVPINVTGMAKAPANECISQLFPKRVLCQIFEHLKQINLAECSLVSQEWYVAARPYLYRHVTLCSAKSFYLFSNRILDNSKKQLGSLVHHIYFGGSLHIRGWDFCRPVDICKLLCDCPQLQSVQTSDIDLLKRSVVEALAKTPKANRFQYLAVIPQLLGNSYYKRCLGLFRHSLTEISLGAKHLTLSTLQRFPNLTKLYVEEISCQSITFYALLDTVPSLQELTIRYPLNGNHFLADFPLKVFPSMRLLDLKFEICSNFHHLHVVHLLSFFTNLQSLTLSLTDGINGLLREDQLYSIDEIVSLISKLGNSSMHVYFRNKSSYLTMPLYLQCILNTLEPVETATQKSALHMLFTENCYLGNNIRYSVSKSSLSTSIPARYITLPSRMSVDLANSLIQQSSLRFSTIEFICRDTSSTFETNSARILNAVLKECSQVETLILHGSSYFESEDFISSTSISQLRLHNPQFHSTRMLQDTLFCFPHLQRIFIQISLHKHWENDMCIYMPSNTLTEICIDVGDPNGCCLTKRALIHALFVVDLEIRQSAEVQHRYFHYYNRSMRQIYNESFEAIKSESEIYRLNLVVNHLDVLLVKHGEYSSKLWDDSLNLSSNE
ncbi:hypothetical protein V8B55DRAFT_1573109 [Mucor lusitanicus]|uniref:F-box domain-containing protein n=2 Tax=Mucor circinelloides f. lusitanicus TaxID=29924 RepID=A0A168HRW7_MUCCL|nr:hypothetical protein FB192DRAFT_1466245 [Mucor lusitanicus]OAC99108.1 hypothetical protein MUCCIDRAFT_114286 [Mucor lusitanicus CBS 277.49]